MWRVACLRRIDYLFSLGSVLVAVGITLKAAALAPNTSGSVPPVLPLSPLLLAFLILALGRGLNSRAAIAAASTAAVLSSSYLSMAVGLFEESLRSGVIASPFIEGILKWGENPSSLLAIIVVFLFFLSSLLLADVIASKIPLVIQPESGSNVAFLLSRPLKIRALAVSGVVLGALIVFLMPNDLSVLPLIVYVFIAPLPVQASLLFLYIFDRFSQIELGLLESMTAVIIFSLVAGEGRARPHTDASFTLFKLSASILILVLLFFTLFNVSFPIYAALYVVYVFSLVIIVFQTEGIGFMLSPLLALSVLQAMTAYDLGGLRQYADPLVPLLTAAIPAALLVLYFTPLEGGNEECSYSAVILLALLAAPLALLLGTKSAGFSFTRQGNLQVSAPGLGLALLSVALTLVQQKVSKHLLLEKGTGFFIPVSLTPLHPVALLIFSILPHALDDRIYLTLFIAAALFSLSLRLAAFLRQITLRDFNVMVIVGAGLALLARLAL